VKARSLPLVVILAASLGACGNPEQEAKNKMAEEQRLLAEQAKAKSEAEAQRARDDCSTTISDQKERYKQLFAHKSYWDAASTVRSCAKILNDQTLQAMLKDAEVRNYIVLLNSKSSDTQSRIIALDSFTTDYPEEALPFQKLRAQLSHKDKWDTKSSEFAAARLPVASNSTCSDSEYSTYQKYDRFLEANPSVHDYELRTLFARKVGMQPTALKNLYMRCTMKWTEQSPDETKAHIKKELEGFAKECAQRPANDPYCKAVFSR